MDRRFRRISRENLRLRNTIRAMEPHVERVRFPQPAIPDEDDIELDEFTLFTDLRYQGEVDADQCLRSGIIGHIIKAGQGDTEAETMDSYAESLIGKGALITYYHWPTIGAKSGTGYTGGVYSPEIDGFNEACAYLNLVSDWPDPDLPLGIDLEASYWPQVKAKKRDPNAAERAQARLFMRRYVSVLYINATVMFGDHAELPLYTSKRKLDEILGVFEEDPEFWRWLVPRTVPWLPRYWERGEAAKDLVPDMEHLPPDPPQYDVLGKRWAMFQFTSEAIVPGIEEEADINLVRTDWLRDYVQASEIATLMGRAE